jgi:2-dehydro-3-deoxyphosphogluconate aldolase / (4S)-4-hydroxy-2-oxoglutarate aldolase
MSTSLPSPAHAFGNLLAGAFVMPIIRIEQRASAVPLARALVAGGVRVFEVLLRTPCAL